MFRMQDFFFDGHNLRTAFRCDILTVRAHTGAFRGEPVQPRRQVLLQHTHRGQTSAVLLGRLWALAGVQSPVPR